MTGEEMERAIEFLLKNQAEFDVRLNRLTEEVRETGKQLRFYAETQTEFIKVVTRHIEEQVRTNAEFRATQTRLAEDLHALATTVHWLVKDRGDTLDQRG
jgi:ribosome recycling factor